MQRVAEIMKGRHQSLSFEICLSKSFIDIAVETTVAVEEGWWLWRLEPEALCC